MLPIAMLEKFNRGYFITGIDVILTWKPWEPYYIFVNSKYALDSKTSRYQKGVLTNKGCYSV